MKIKVGDKVKVLSGKDKGKTGKVLQVFVKEGKAVVEGLNLMIKHQRARRQGETGQRIQFPSPLSISNIALICPKCGASARVGFQMIKAEDGKRTKSRQCKKCHETI